MANPSTIQRTWVLHDGELGDVSALLKELGAEVCEPGEGGDAGALGPAALVVATARRALELPEVQRGGEDPPILIVIQDWNVRTLPEPGRFDFVLRRPFHPATLRLLVLQAFYQGPERRRSERVSIGANVRFRAGLWRRSALLVELAMGGCRLLSRHAVRSGQRITVILPPALAEGPELSLPGRVVRFGPGEGADFQTRTIGVEFEPFPHESWQRLSALLSRHASSRLSRRSAAPEEKAAESATASAGGAGPGASRPASHSASCRRRAPRRAYPRRVIALGTQNARVLTGRDLSPGGMRADPNPNLSVGDELRLALHVRPGHRPLVVRARVARDDGERGLVLRFEELPRPAADYLQKMLDALPLLGSGDPDGAAADRRVFAEIMENGAD